MNCITTKDKHKRQNPYINFENSSAHVTSQQQWRCSAVCLQHSAFRILRLIWVEQIFNFVFSGSSFVRIRNVQPCWADEFMQYMISFIRSLFTNPPPPPLPYISTSTTPSQCTVAPATLLSCHGTPVREPVKSLCKLKKTHTMPPAKLYNIYTRCSGHCVHILAVRYQNFARNFSSKSVHIHMYIYTQYTHVCILMLSVLQLSEYYCLSTRQRAIQNRNLIIL